MTKEEAKRKQDDLERKGYKLSYWYGTNCEKCCGVYPAFKDNGANDSACWYECEVCGKRTKGFEMPWLAEKAWNNHEYLPTQITFF